MADITMLIRADHDWFRERFAKLDDLQAQTPIDHAALERLWRPLGEKLDLHAYIEEKIFYPQLLKRGTDDPEGETLDAIGDHNDIRDGVRAANAATIGTDQWWAAVGQTRKANDDHMSEEEREGLSDFRRHAPMAFVYRLGGSTASSWPNIAPPREYQSSTAIRNATSRNSRTPRCPNARTTRCASAA